MEAHPRSDKRQNEFLPRRRKITVEGKDSAKGGHIEMLDTDSAQFGGKTVGIFMKEQGQKEGQRRHDAESEIYGKRKTGY